MPNSPAELIGDIPREPVKVYLPSVKTTPNQNQKKLFLGLSILLAVCILDGFLLIVYKLKQSRLTEDVSLIKIENWKSYTNQKYSFEIKYPPQYQAEDDAEPEEFYDHLADFLKPGNPSPIISLKAIEGIDIYEKAPPKLVAEREISDAPHFGYSLREIKLGDYKTAVARVKFGGPESKAEELMATIAHPGKNLFIEIAAETSVEEFNQILKTFMFLDSTGIDQNSVEGRFCGGIAANLPENQCPSGYKCQLEGDYPDAGGRCVRE